MATSDRSSTDPITMEIIRYGVASITDQIDANITRTAFSPYIYEYKDFAVGLAGPTGDLVAQCRGGMPIFVADSFGMAVRDGLTIYGVDRLFHGDVLICNHASVQGQHLNNTVMYAPIFVGPHKDTLVGFFAINMHWVDIGGSVPRSSDIFMEGIQFRSIKIRSKGEPIEEVYRIIECNSREPQALMGDIAAQLAGCMLGAELTANLAERYGSQTYFHAIEAMLDQSEHASRKWIESLPDGVYSAEAFLDNDGEGDQPIHLPVSVIVAGDEMTIDYSRISAQVAGCINSGYFGGGRTTARVAFKYLLGDGEPANEGTFRPLKIILPPGKILSADATAPMGNYSQPFPTAIDVIIRALAKASPGSAVAGHYGSFSGFRFMGRGADGARFDNHANGYGGWGARDAQDGTGPFRTMAHGDTRIIPMELQEALYPMRLEGFSLREDSGGVGAFRGGLGVTYAYRVHVDCKLIVKFDRIDCPPWGIAGGGAGKPGHVRVEKPDGTIHVLRKTKGFPLEANDLVHIETGGGGGYGEPHARDKAILRHDVLEGYVSPASAEQNYGGL